MRTGLLVSSPIKPELREKIAAGTYPQQDYFALADALDATIMAPLKGGRRSGWHKLTAITGPAWEAFRRRSEFDVIISDMDRVGMVLAFLLKVSGSRQRHIVICHGKMAKENDLRLLKYLDLSSHIHRFVCYGPLVAERVQKYLGLPSDRFVVVRHAADHRFWHPLTELPTPPAPSIEKKPFVLSEEGVSAAPSRRTPIAVTGTRSTEPERATLPVAGVRPGLGGAPPGSRGFQPHGQRPVIVSAGMLKRDYPTLVKAVTGLDVDLVIAASSPWMADAEHKTPAVLPPNVQVTKLGYKELRDLYARALFVAVPLLPSQAQSGSLVVYEAMAMGKAVVATRTDGQDEMAIIREGVTGHYVGAGDAEGWRTVIQHLMQHPETAASMGREARRQVEDGLNMQTFVSAMVKAVTELQVRMEPVPLAAAPHLKE